jgi:hypothetical protein
MLSFLFGKKDTPLLTLNDKIRKNDYDAVSEMIRERKGRANEAIEGHFPLCIAMVADKFHIFKFLLDHGADPMKTKEDSTFHGNEHLMDFCFTTSKRPPFLELMVFHPNCSVNVIKYLRDTYLVGETCPKTLAPSTFRWLKQLIETLGEYHSADNQGKLKIIEARIKKHEQLYPTLEEAQEHEAVSNLKQLVHYLGGLSRSLRPHDSDELVVTGDGFTGHGSTSNHGPQSDLLLGQADFVLTHRKREQAGDVASTSVWSLEDNAEFKKK